MLGIVAVFALCFAPTLLSGKAILMVDSLCYSYPLRSIAWQQIRDGSLPLWTPLIFSGYPLLSMGQLSLGYPLTWGYLFLPGQWAEQIYVLAPFLLAPAFLYAYIRELGLSRLAALLAGLSFAYSGLTTNILGHNGLTSNAVMWLPLLLICIERARTRRLATCVLWGGLVYAMSVLNGYGQGFLYVGILSVGYALCLGLAPPRAHQPHDDDERPAWLSSARWRPLLAAVCSIMAGAGVAAFQVFESMGAVRLSIRSALTFELFTTGSFTPRTILKSLLFPAYYELEVTTYMPLLAIVLAATGSAVAIRRRRDARVFYWLATAVVAWALMLGDYTPLSRLLYHVPLVNLFRSPVRHVFEWSFAVAILSAYGWDALSAWSARRPVQSPRRKLAISLTTLVLATLVGAVWWTRLSPAHFPNQPLNREQVETSYIVCKAAFTILTFLGIWVGWRISQGRRRTGALTGAILLTCFVEPFILLSVWWLPWAKPAGQYAMPSVAAGFLRNYDPAQHRAYLRVDLFADQFSDRPRVDAPNLSMLAGIHNVAGYEPLILERYSRALGNVAMDGFNPRPGFRYDLSHLGSRSHVLDLLNTKFLVTFSNFSAAPITRSEHSTMQTHAGVRLPDELSRDKWRVVYNADDILILHNERALPRAWLVAEAEAVDGEEALRRIRGESTREFEPRRTALLEVAPGELPVLPGGQVGSNATARVSYQPNGTVIETYADTAALLVLSEMNYPGWTATIDGNAQPIFTTNFLLRSVAVPPGAHRVEMKYRAPAARTGAWISLSTLLLLTFLASLSRRSAKTRAGIIE
jgi:hypothetical protein